jgi:hypothetical protein
MPFRPPRKQPQFADLKGVLSQSKQTDNALYQTVQILIERLMQFQSITVDRLAGIDKELEQLFGEIQGTGGDEPTVYDCPLSDGDLIEAELIFADGECIIVQVPVL